MLKLNRKITPKDLQEKLDHNDIKLQLEILEENNLIIFYKDHLIPYYELTEKDFVEEILDIWDDLNNAYIVYSLGSKTA